jgi:arylsulfatase A-like enzyme
MSERPNIVFVFADDWGWGDLGCYGHPVVKTPNLDSLAAEGTLFTQFYVCSGVCSPSRAAVMTGQFPARNRIHGHLATHQLNDQRGMPDWLDPGISTYMRLLQAAGYRTGHFGKWHLGNGPHAPEPTAYGIDESRVNSGNGSQLEFRREDWGPGLRSRSSEFIVNHTIDFIERCGDNPFIANVWLNDTHAILDPSPDQMELYSDLRPQYVGDEHWGAPAIYYATVTEADRQIGRLMQRLAELGKTENTIFLFSSDNGPEDILIRNASHSGVGSSGPFRGRKRSLYEGGVRTPFILRWPGRGGTAGVVDNTTPLCGADLLPTFCDVAGVAPPSDLLLDGENMSDVFRGNQRERSTPLMWEWRFGIAGHPIHKSPMLSIREDRWKLLLNPDRGRVELFHIPDDPMELNNVADSNTAIVDRLAKGALKWQDTLPPGPIEADAGTNDYPWPV